eukprot:COSAG01_NODE_1280_length_10925_cov_23.969333_10_plen_37_part_00
MYVMYVRVLYYCMYVCMYVFIQHNHLCAHLRLGILY